MKAKTRSLVKRRVRITGSGKVKVMKAARKHLLQQKSKKQKRLGKTGKAIMVHPTRLRDIRRALPYL